MIDNFHLKEKKNGNIWIDKKFQVFLFGQFVMCILILKNQIEKVKQ